MPDKTSKDAVAVGVLVNHGYDDAKLVVPDYLKKVVDPFNKDAKKLLGYVGVLKKANIDYDLTVRYVINQSSRKGGSNYHVVTSLSIKVEGLPALEIIEGTAYKKPTYPSTPPVPKKPLPATPPPAGPAWKAAAPKKRPPRT